MVRRPGARRLDRPRSRLGSRALGLRIGAVLFGILVTTVIFLTVLLQRLAQRREGAVERRPRLGVRPVDLPRGLLVEHAVPVEKLLDLRRVVLALELLGQGRANLLLGVE